MRCFLAASPAPHWSSERNACCFPEDQVSCRRIGDVLKQITRHGATSRYTKAEFKKRDQCLEFQVAGVEDVGEVLEGFGEPEEELLSESSRALLALQLGYFLRNGHEDIGFLGTVHEINIID
ncbi:unnamed protein product [Sphagnum balticum]